MNLMLCEGTVTLIDAHIQANIKAALAAVSTSRADNLVGLEPPRSFFVYEKAHAYECPAIFTVHEDFDFDLQEGQNFVNGKVKVIVSSVVEDRDEQTCQRKSWRYQSALFDLLNELELLGYSDSVQLKCLILRMSPSGLYVKKAGQDDSESVFRKEVIIELEVQHRENF